MKNQKLTALIVFFSTFSLVSCGGYHKASKLKIYTLIRDEFNFKVKNYSGDCQPEWDTNRFYLRDVSTDELEKEVEKQSIAYEKYEDGSLFFISEIGNYLSPFFIYHDQYDDKEEKDIYVLSNTVTTANKLRLILPLPLMQDKSKEGYLSLQDSIWSMPNTTEKKTQDYQTEFNYPAFKAYYQIVYKPSIESISFDDAKQNVVFYNSITLNISEEHFNYQIN